MNHAACGHHAHRYVGHYDRVAGGMLNENAVKILAFDIVPAHREIGV